jgi:ribosome-binding protein aMBF1 (putative translation factor)
MDDKIKAFEEFLMDLEATENIDTLIDDRLSDELLEIIERYSQVIMQIKEKAGLSEEELVSSSIVIGFLLKGHLDRYELEQSIKDANQEDI